ncbi:hypothetical protein BDE18_1107 [Paracoccus pantotrophus]|uniref:Uncharacterized protein n=1 Tax=Paracoccus pantotrophus TaxID=82367 RepID=A0AAE6NWG2_PARPN|nr:DUF6477 family protein [Paracoccus pantotrophus]QFG37704.1 hypothetical protein ESD82_16520 [Paracoccus pantotrophus]RKS51835.1 hypothetical protein BDE18_1107 [Paracoccus pantotrophus]
MTMMSNVIAFQPRPGQPHLRRPRLLVRAARAGQVGWRRSRDLHRVLKCETPPPAGKALSRLLAEEERLDLLRRSGQAGYDMHRHILLLIAILAETAEAAPRPVPNPVTCP